MYSDEDMDYAVEKGIFTPGSVEKFRAEIAQRNHSPAADEENFKLIASFNDIFVVIACTLLLVSSGWVVFEVHPGVSGIVVTALAWGLAEFFVRKRKMALPAVFLLVVFVGGAFSGVMGFFNGGQSVLAPMLAAVVAIIAAGLHWSRFKVPITVAAGALAGVVFVISLVLSIIPEAEDYLEYLLLASGVLVFLLAFRWDAKDLQRVTRQSDVAFWLHLASAPLVVHPIFDWLGVFDGNQQLSNLVVIVALYCLLTLISLVIDRRAFMVSSLIYVLVALSQLFEMYGLAGDSFAYVGVLIGFSLLLLSGLWHKARQAILGILPDAIQSKVPRVA